MKRSDSLRRRLVLGSMMLATSAMRPALATTVIIGDSRGEMVEGSGVEQEEVRAVSGFSRVQLRGPMTVRLKRGAEEKVTVRADENILPLIETVAEGGQLVVGVKQGTSFRTRSRLSVVVEFKKIEGLELLSSGDVTADDIEAGIFEGTIKGSGGVRIARLRADTVAISISGSGAFGAKGRAGTVGVVIKGSGDVRAEDLEAKSVAVQISGSGDARVFATESLQARIAGSGDIRYRGSPRVEKQVRGSGDVRPLR